MGYWNKKYAIEKKFNEKFDYPKCGGIYLWTRTEGELTYFYVGQAKNLHNRMLHYYMIRCGVVYPDRHFERSLKTHKNWKVEMLSVYENATKELLNEKESYYLNQLLAKPFYVSRNSVGISGGISYEDVRVLSNKKRSENIAKKAREEYKKLFSNLNIVVDGETMIKIEPIKTKKGAPSVKSSEAYKNLIELLKEEK